MPSAISVIPAGYAAVATAGAGSSTCYPGSVLPRQLGLFSVPTPGFDAGFAAVRRLELDEDAWIEHAPGWVSGHDALFDELERAVAWRSERRPMYDRVVDVPRLVAGPLPVPHPLLEAMRVALSERYGETFTRVSFALYRDGKDSVAWHGDTTARDMDEPTLVATVSLGEPRRFLLRPRGGGRTIPFSLGRGDLFVMGGACQRTWQHAVPKVARALPRLAVMFRPIWREPV